MLFCRFNFDCSEAEDFYSINDLLGSEEPIANDDSSLSASNQQVPTQSNNQGTVYILGHMGI